MRRQPSGSSRRRSSSPRLGGSRPVSSSTVRLVGLHSMRSFGSRPTPGALTSPRLPHEVSVACEPKATVSFVLVADVAPACRRTRASGAPSKSMNVALLERSNDAATRSMSRFTRVRSDIPRRACRSGSPGGATYQGEHVAPDPRDARHTNPRMSLDELVKGDMPARLCRLTHVCSATLIDDNVAPPAQPERHVKRCVSPDAIVRSDIHDLVCRLTRLASATWTRRHVAAPRLVKRHSLV
jgi:hypothetical protein